VENKLRDTIYEYLDNNYPIVGGVLQVDVNDMSEVQEEIYDMFGTKEVLFRDWIFLRVGETPTIKYMNGDTYFYKKNFDLHDFKFPSVIHFNGRMDWYINNEFRNTIRGKK
jgi:hypothetical protein